MANHEAASSSSAQEPRKHYDVFLSFRGKDTRTTFTGYLYNALQQKGINTFIDNKELRIGDQLSPSLLQAIEESRISIVVLSENYASSKWCLEELSKILECKDSKNQLVWPIFYKVVPSDVRYQKNSYGEAMTKHENRSKEETEKKKMLKWRSALSQVSLLKGWEWHPETGYEYELIHEIVKMVATKLHREHLYIGEHVIGHQSRIEEVKLLLDVDSSNTCMLGIHGTGGIGKTTLAKALYNLIVNGFECAAFLGCVRERSNGYNNMLQLQEQLLSQLLQDKYIKLGSVDEGANKIKRALCYRKVLMVLDDVDKLEQLEKLSGGCDWFGNGSRIIITTRDKHLLNVHNVEKSYEMKLLNDHEALELFCWSAFKTSQPATSYEDVSSRAVRYAKGLPLALKVIGSNLINKSVKECEYALKQYERIPKREIHDMLKVSYDSLEDNVKDIFLDIACFFKGDKLEYVEKILAACDFFPEYNIGVLVDKSLLTIEHGCLMMHDLIQDMGREIVRQEAPSKPGYRSRLCFHEDVLRILTENSGSSNIEGIMLDPPEQEEVEWSGTAFENMNNLRILVLWNAHFSIGPNYLPNSLRLLEWNQYPSESLPPRFDPKKIVVLSLPNSCLRMIKSFQNYKFLANINFSGCQFLTHVPNMAGAPFLRELRLESCDNLIEIHESVGFLKHLVVLTASKCGKLSSFLPSMWLPSLETLKLKDCPRLEHFPDIAGEMKKPLYLSLWNIGIKELPQSIDNLIGLKTVGMELCTSLRDIPCNFFMLPKMELLNFGRNAQLIVESFRRFQSSELVATSCSNLRRLCFVRCKLSDEDLHVILKCFPKLETLEVPGNDFVSLPACIKESVNLRRLEVNECLKLQEIPELPSNIQGVDAQYCPSLTSETLSMLWSQAFKEVYKLRVVMPETKIPDWFNHRCEGDTISFWAHQKFPIVAVAFIFKKVKEKDYFDVRLLYKKENNEMCLWGLPFYYKFAKICLYINGCHTLDLKSSGWNSFDIAECHVLLCDLRALFKAEEWPVLDTFLEHDWNHVEVKCEIMSNEDQYYAISECGAYVYKQQTNINDIQFDCPNRSTGEDRLKKRKLALDG